MNWQQLAIAMGLAATFAGGAWKLAEAWTKKAIALGEKAEAERAAARELAELRSSFAKFMERMQSAESRLGIVEARMDERERHRRDTQGIPLRERGDGE